MDWRWEQVLQLEGLMDIMEDKETRPTTLPGSETCTTASGPGNKKEWDDRNVLSLAILLHQKDIAYNERTIRRFLRTDLSDLCLLRFGIRILQLFRPLSKKDSLHLALSHQLLIQFAGSPSAKITSGTATSSGSIHTGYTITWSGSPIISFHTLRESSSRS